MNRLGIDIGRVIIDGSSHPDGGDTAFFSGDRATLLRTPAMPLAFETIARLTALFDRQVWLVSKAGPRVQQRSLDWLHHHDFFTHTGIPATNVRFCLRRADKAIHCTELAITHFIDDNLEVHQALAGLAPPPPLPLRPPTPPQAPPRRSTHPQLARHRDSDRLLAPPHSVGG